MRRNLKWVRHREERVHGILVTLIGAAVWLTILAALVNTVVHGGSVE